MAFAAKIFTRTKTPQVLASECGAKLSGQLAEDLLLHRIDLVIGQGVRW